MARPNPKPDYREIADSMSDADAKAYLLDTLEVLSDVSISRRMSEKYGFDFPRYMDRAFAVLHRHLGQTVHKSSIMDALYFDQVGDEPNIKVVDVYICKIRQALEGTPFKIHTEWGFGYRMTGPDQ